MDTLDRSLWPLFIVVTCINGAVMWSRGQKYVVGNVDLYERFKSFVASYVVFSNLPWMVWGLASTFGGYGFFELVRFPHTDPYQWLFDAAMFLLWLATLISVFFRDGAQMMTYTWRGNVPDFYRNPNFIKVLAAIMLIAGPMLYFGLMTNDF